MTRPLPALLPTACALLLAACGDGAEDAVPEAREAAEREVGTAVSDERSDEPASSTALTPASDPNAPTAPITDLLGQFGGTVPGLAVWAHPVTPYLGSVVAANGEAGLTLVPLDPETAPRTQEGTFDGAVGVGYLDSGASVIAAVSGGQVRLFEVGDDRRLTEAGTFPSTEDASLCFDGARLYMAAPVQLDFVMEPSVTLSTGERVTMTSVQGTFCARITEGVVLTDRASFGADAPLPAASVADAVQVAVVRTPDPTLVMLGQDGRLRIGDRPVTLTRDGAPQEPYARIAAGSGNFGGVHRDGVVVVLDAENRLMAAPWSGIARAVGAPVETASRRPEPEDAAPTEFRPELPEVPGLTRPGGEGQD